VRCDVAIWGMTCSNCRHSDVEYALASRRGRGGFHAADSVQQFSAQAGKHSMQQVPSSFSDSSHLLHPTTLDGDVVSLQSPLAHSCTQASSTESHLSNSTNDNDLFAISSKTFDDHASIDAPYDLSLDVESSLMILSGPPPESGQTKLASVTKQNVPQMHQQPSRIILNLRPLAYDDLEYLKRKDALSIPRIGLRKELMGSYIRYALGQMPILDFNDVQKAVGASIHGNGTEKSMMSLFLYQAIMLAGLPFVRLQSLQDAGYATSGAAYDALFSRVKAWFLKLLLVA